MIDVHAISCSALLKSRSLHRLDCRRDGSCFYWGKLRHVVSCAAYGGLFQWAPAVLLPRHMGKVLCNQPFAMYAIFFEYSYGIIRVFTCLERFFGDFIEHAMQPSTFLRCTAGHTHTDRQTHMHSNAEPHNRQAQVEIKGWGCAIAGQRL